jgi:hypothetical protein
VLPTFDIGARRILIRGIGVYQRHISPRKGFRCASRALHGGDSCSQAIKHLLGEQPLRQALKGARQQFALCHAANRTLRASRAPGGARLGHQARFDNDQWLDDEPSNRRSRNRNRSCWPQRQPDCCELGDCACHGIELGECLMPHGGHCARLPFMHALDCSALDCAVLDCSFLDCGVCACWPF